LSSDKFSSGRRRGRCASGRSRLSSLSRVLPRLRCCFLQLLEVVVLGDVQREKHHAQHAEDEDEDHEEEDEQEGAQEDQVAEEPTAEEVKAEDQEQKPDAKAQ